jgi:hypothetical protein
MGFSQQYVKLASPHIWEWSAWSYSFYEPGIWRKLVRHIEHCNRYTALVISQSLSTLIRRFGTSIWRIAHVFIYKYDTSCFRKTSAFTANNCTKIFLGDQPCQYRVKNQLFRNVLHLHHQSRSGEWPYVTWKSMLKKKIWKELIPYFPSSPHEPHRKRSVQQFLYCCVCNPWWGNVFTEPLPSNSHIQTHRRQGFMKYAVQIG